MHRSRTLSASMIAALFTLIFASLSPVFLSSTFALAANTITGVVFHDYNANGTRDSTITIPNSSGTGTVRAAIDSGIGSVTVTAFDANNTAVATTTASDGTYTLNVPAAGPYRVEFSGLPTAFEPTAQGTTSNTTVQFVAGPTMVANLGINRPAEYCQDNPTLVLSCFIQGDQVNGPNKTDDVLKSFPYAAGSNRTTGSTPFTDYDTPTTHTTHLDAQTLGTTWGVAWARSTKRLYSSAFFRRHAGFGPGGQGAIYVINPQTNTVVNTWTLPAATTNAHDTSNYSRDNGNTGWDAVGKTSLGGIALSDDETTLYVMSLQDRTVYALNATTGAVLTSQPATPGLTGCPAASDARPFALKYYQSTLYVGIVCSAESTGSAADLHAYVYSVNPTTLVFNTTPVFQFSFNYARGTTGFGSANWHAWAPTFSNIAGGAFDGQTNLLSYPQPILSDIEFDSSGNLILGLRDRAGDQGGYRELSGPLTDNKLYLTASGGDTLYACLSSPGNWTLESNGRCNGQGAGPQGVTQGPGGGEYYYADNLLMNHDETSLGGLAQVPGYPDVISTVFDPVPLNDNATNNSDGGVRWWDNSTGGYIKGYRAYDGQANADDQYFGKANGLGDLIALCDAAPIEIGNRVWNDINHNGIQDAGEPGIAGVVLGLYDSTGTLITTVTTDNNGTYAFSSASGATVTGRTYGVNLQPTTSYTVAVYSSNTATSGALVGYIPTSANSTSNTTNQDASGATPDTTDSDGVTVAVGSGTNVATTGVSITTGAAGVNNHSLDFGFSAPVSIGNQVWYDTDNNGVINGIEVGVDGVAVNLFRDVDGNGILTGAEQIPVATQTTTSGGYYLFTRDSNGAVLNAGTYLVGIAASNFATGGTLFGTRSSGTTISTAGVVSEAAIAVNGSTDSNVDNADDGTTQTSGFYTGGVLSGPLVITVGGEPGGTTPGHPNTIEGTAGGTAISNINSNLTVDFGFYRQTLGNLVFNDANNNGIYDTGDTFIAGATVKLFAANGTTEIAVGPDGILGTADDAAGGVTTTATGAYLFQNLPQGQYVVSVTPPAGYTSSTDISSSATPDGNVDNDDNGIGSSQGTATSAVITLTPGSTGTSYPNNIVNPTTGTTANPTLDFGFYTLSLGNLVWNDTNNNGILDGSEAGINGVTVNLYTDTNGNGTLDAGDTFVINQITANNGHYLFSGLAPATYFVQIDPANFGIGALLAGYQSSTGTNGALTGPYEPGATGTTDNDDNGTTGTGGLSTSGVTGGIVSGPLVLTVGTQPTDELDMGTPSGAPDTASNANSNLTIDFGVYQPASLGDFVWFDTNKNGVQDAGELGVNGVQVSLYDSAGTTLIARTTTANNGTIDGYYHFANLLPNTDYLIKLDRANDFTGSGPLAGYTLTSADQGGNDTADSDATFVGGVPTIVARTDGAGTDNPTFDAGFNTSASLGDYVWLDANNNGVQDATETGINGVTVNLYDSTNTLVATTITANNGANDGAYQFANLTPNTTYTVRLNNPADFTGTGPLANTQLSPAFQGGNPATDSNAMSVGGFPTISTALTGGPGSDTPTYDIGVYRPSASLGDYVWNDANKNGVQDATETGINGVTVHLYDSTGTTLIATTTTATNGSTSGYYHFANLVPNTTYTVKLDNPADYASGGPLAGFTLTAATQGGNPATDSDATLIAGYPTISNAPTGANQSDTLTYDIGLYQPLSLGNLVWNDVNNNGMKEAGELGVDGVLVHLYRDTNGNSLLDAADTLINSQTTSNGGHYLFTDLGQATYFVQLDATNFQTGGPLLSYHSSTGRVGSATGPYEPGATTPTDNTDKGTNMDGGIVSGPVVLAAGSQPTNEPDRGLPNGVTDSARDNNSNLAVDFGVFQSASLGSLVWRDTNGDGVYQPTEPGVPNVTVTLYDASGTPVATTITDADGHYQFINLAPGSYTVGFTNLPSGFGFTAAKQGSDADDSDVDVNTGRTNVLVLGPGQNMLTVFAGILTPTAITLTQFTATWVTDGVSMAWTTSAEHNTFSFHLYRSATANQSDAVRVTSTAIAARGRGTSGASYRWIDTSAQTGTTYTYWLMETEVDGTTHVYGPATLAAAITQSTHANTRMFLPFVTR